MYNIGSEFGEKCKGVRSLYKIDFKYVVIFHSDY